MARGRGDRREAESQRFRRSSTRESRSCTSSGPMHWPPGCRCGSTSTGAISTSWARCASSAPPSSTSCRSATSPSTPLCPCCPSRNFGGVGNETAALFFAIVGMCFLVRLATGPPRLLARLGSHPGSGSRGVGQRARRADQRGRGDPRGAHRGRIGHWQSDRRDALLSDRARWCWLRSQSVAVAIARGRRARRGGPATGQDPSRLDLREPVSQRGKGGVGPGPIEPRRRGGEADSPSPSHRLRPRGGYPVLRSRIQTTSRSRRTRTTSRSTSWLRLGLVGLVLFAIALHRLHRRRTPCRGADIPIHATAALALALVAVLAGLLVTGFLEPMLDEYRFAALFGLSLGMLRACVTSMDSEPRLPPGVEEASARARCPRLEWAWSRAKPRPRPIAQATGDAGMLVRAASRPRRLAWSGSPCWSAGCRTTCVHHSPLGTRVEEGQRRTQRGCRDASRGAGMDIRQIVRTVRANWVVALVTFLVCLLHRRGLCGAAGEDVSGVGGAAGTASGRAPDPGSDVGAIQTQIPQIAVEAENPTVEQRSERPSAGAFPARCRSTITATADPSSNTVTINCLEYGSCRRPGVRQRHGCPGADGDEPRRRAPTSSLSELGGAELPTTPTNPRGTVAIGVRRVSGSLLRSSLLSRPGRCDEVPRGRDRGAAWAFRSWASADAGSLPARIRPICSSWQRTDVAWRHSSSSEAIST